MTAASRTRPAIMPYRRSRTLTVLFACANVIMFARHASGQPAQQPPLPTDPTPIQQLLTAAEKAAVEESRDPKRVVDEYLRIAEAHLTIASSTIDGGDFRASERELDIYNKAAAEALKIAFSQPSGKRNLAKKIEQRIYKQIKMLETVERRFPAERTPFATAALNHARRLRVRALNEAFGTGDVLKTQPDDSSGARWRPNPRPDSPLTYSFVSSSAAANGRQLPADYLNEEEDEHVRQAQQIDERMKVFMKIADRRLAALSPDSAAPADKKAQKKLEEELKEWGAVPKVSRAELLNHYAKAVEEAIAKVEDAHERNPKSTAIPKALTTLRDATDRHLQMLEALSAGMTDNGETIALRRAIDEAKFANNGAREGLK